MVNKEIEEGERESAAARKMSGPPAANVGKSSKVDPRAARREERIVKKEMNTLERNIARLDGDKKQKQQQLLTSTDPAEALRLHNEVAALTTELAEAEERWLVLQEELGEEW
jgi:ATP-binding cassette subfamily F protein 3